MDLLLMGGLAAAGDTLVSPLTYPPLYKSLSGINQSLPAGVNGSIMGLASYVLVKTVNSNQLRTSEMLGIVATVSALQVGLGRTIYWPLASRIGQSATSYLFNGITGAGTVLGVMIGDMF